MQRKLMVLAIVFFSLLLLSSNDRVANAQSQFSEAGVQKLRVAVEAPDFTLKEVGGGKISLKEFRGKIILLNFFATW